MLSWPRTFACRIMNLRLTSLSPRTVLIRAALVALPFAAVAFVMLGLANLVVERSLGVAFGSADTDHSGAWYEWDGDITASDVVVASDADADDASAVRFDRIHVDTAGWLWVLRHLFDRRLEPSGLRELDLSFFGVHSGLGTEPTLGQLGPFGAISASPFEAEGCMVDQLWRREDLDRMGLSPGESRLHYRYSVDGTQLATRIELETPGSSRVAFERTSDVAPGAEVFSVDATALPTRRERWEIRDEGFVSARNRFCTRKDQIDLRRYIERHVEAVERLLATHGFGLDADSRIAYRRFVRDGGTLVFTADYIEPFQRAAADGTGVGAMLGAMDARIEHNGRGNPITWQRFGPRPLPLAENGETTYATLSRERTAAMRGETLAAAAAANAAADPGLASPTGDTGVEVEAAAGGDAAVAAADPVPTAANAAPVEPRADASADPTPAANEVAPLAATPEPPPVAPAPSPTQTPVTVPRRPSTASITPAPPSTRRQRLAWNDLPNYRGRMVRIWTVHNPPRTVEILSGGESSLRVTARLGGGRAEYTIQREGFIRATLVQ